MPGSGSRPVDSTLLEDTPLLLELVAEGFIDSHWRLPVSRFRLAVRFELFGKTSH